MKFKRESRAIHIILDEGKKLISSVNHLRSAAGNKPFEQLSRDDFEEAQKTSHGLIKHLKRLSLEDIVPDNALISSEHFFYLLDFKSIRRKSVRSLKGARRSLIKSEKFFVRQDAKKLYKWLGHAIDDMDDAFYFLHKLNVRVSTAHDTDESVQIQIQKGQEKM